MTEQPLLFDAADLPEFIPAEIIHLGRGVG
jgi:hypothetical protein